MAKVTGFHWVPMNEQEIERLNAIWGVNQWVRHPCPFKDGEVVTHSIHFHHPRDKCNPKERKCEIVPYA